MSTDGEQELIQGVLRGDQKSLRRFEQKYRQRLFNFVLQKIDDERDAEEIVQDVIYSAVVCLPSFLGKSSLWTWLGSIAHHEIVDFYRKKKIKTILFSRFPALKNLANKALSPELALEEKELREKILGCLFGLTEGYRQVLRLKYTEGLSVRQIACRLKKTAKAIEMRLRRARFAYACAWNQDQVSQKGVFTLHPGDLSFFKECLGALEPSL